MCLIREYCLKEVNFYLPVTVLLSGDSWQLSQSKRPPEREHRCWNAYNMVGLSVTSKYTLVLKYPTHFEINNVFPFITSLKVGYGVQQHFNTRVLFSKSTTFETSFTSIFGGIPLFLMFFQTSCLTCFT